MTYIPEKEIRVKSEHPVKSRGNFHLLGTTIGNLRDFPPRTLELARSCDLLIVEEDRPARQLLKAAGVHRTYLRFSEHYEQETLNEARSVLKKGGLVAYASDQGMPNLSDPGWQLTEIAVQLGSKISVVPGPSSISAAIAVCPFNIEQFFFAGFIPRQEAQREAELKRLSNFPFPIVLMETPYRRAALLEKVSQTFPPQRQAVLAFDISGEYEAIICSTAGKLASLATDLPAKKPFVLVIDR